MRNRVGFVTDSHDSYHFTIPDSVHSCHFLSIPESTFRISRPAHTRLDVRITEGCQRWLSDTCRGWRVTCTIPYTVDWYGMVPYLIGTNEDVCDLAVLTHLYHHRWLFLGRKSLHMFCNHSLQIHSTVKTRDSVVIHLWQSTDNIANNANNASNASHVEKDSKTCNINEQPGCHRPAGSVQPLTDGRTACEYQVDLKKSRVTTIQPQRELLTVSIHFSKVRFHIYIQPQYPVVYLYFEKGLS